MVLVCPSQHVDPMHRWQRHMEAPRRRWWSPCRPQGCASPVLLWLPRRLRSSRWPFTWTFPLPPTTKGSILPAPPASAAACTGALTAVVAVALKASAATAELRGPRTGLRAASSTGSMMMMLWTLGVRQARPSCCGAAAEQRARIWTRNVVKDQHMQCGARAAWQRRSRVGRPSRHLSRQWRCITDGMWAVLLARCLPRLRCCHAPSRNSRGSGSVIVCTSSTWR